MTHVYFRILKYLIAYPLIILYIAVSFQPSYSYYRLQFLAQMNRVYEKDRQKQTEIAMTDLGSRFIPPMPASEMK